jgi:hypothetical protein
MKPPDGSKEGVEFSVTMLKATKKAAGDFPGGPAI